MDFPTRVRIGEGAVGALVEEVADHQLRRALVVSDKGVVEAGLVARVARILEGAQVEWHLFDKVQTNPEEEDVLAGVEAYRQSGADHLVAVGGGAAIDTAKGIRLLVNHPGPLSRYDDALGGGKHVTGELPPLFAVPTTAGTGSEVGRAFVVTLEGRKAVIFSPRLIPTAAICDPVLTLGLPPEITAATGMDALSHNVEAYLARGFHPLADAIAIRGISLVARFLPRAVKSGAEDLDARTAMMSAALMGAVAFQKGLGGIHSLAHALGSECGLHHGLANALVMPTMLRFNAEAVPDRMLDVATALGASGAGYGSEPGERAAQRVMSLCKDIGLPASLGELKIGPGMAEALVDAAHADGCHQSNPRPVTRSDFVRLVESLF
ncbi:MAG: iron-containing alcohol dehydrogenase [Deltaproteobacteria bacterium]|nr:iron-containing alcohol dehydrogenase [Deltaproteobacteria bacterium]